MTDTNATTTAAETTATTEAATTTANTLLGGAGEQTQQAENSLLGGQQAEQQQQEQAASQPEKYVFPDKFQVKTGDEVDFDASVRKLGEAYSSLEKRFGAGEARPADVSGYKFDETFGEGFAEAFTKDPNGAKWLADAHGLGLNNAQVNFFIKEMLAAQPSTAEKTSGYTTQQATEELQKVWTEPATYQANLNAADRAARSLLKADYPQFIGRYGNDPQIIKLLASVGSEMGEDALRMAGLPVMSADSVDDLMRSEAYTNETHPDHRRVSKQVSDYWARVAGRNEVI